jgi:hypothetical protein
MVDIKSKVNLLKLSFLVIKVTVWEMMAAQWLNTVAVFLVKCNNLQLVSTLSPLSKKLLEEFLAGNELKFLFYKVHVCLIHNSCLAHSQMT